jgi:hypothetical protein
MRKIPYSGISLCALPYYHVQGCTTLFCINMGTVFYRDGLTFKDHHSKSLKVAHWWRNVLFLVSQEVYFTERNFLLFKLPKPFLNYLNQSRPFGLTSLFLSTGCLIVKLSKVNRSEG